MEAIFHEKQEGSLCAQHCLNALLQGGYFTAVDLAELAQQLDETERQRMAEAGVHSLAYQQFLEQPSSNFDDSGFFSIQVLQTALRVWNVDLILYNSSDPAARAAREDPRTQQAYICNFREHWFTVRKLGHQWFNLNSLLSGPELISDTYLSLFLTQLQQEGYSLFIVQGDLPDCDADELLRVIPAIQPIKPHLLTDSARSDGYSEEDSGDAELRRVLEESRKQIEDEDGALHQAIALSMQNMPQDVDSGGGQKAGPSAPATSSSTSTSTHSASASEQEKPSAQEIREKRLAFLSKVETKEGTSPSQPAQAVTNEESENKDESTAEDDNLEAAIKLSMQCT